MTPNTGTTAKTAMSPFTGRTIHVAVKPNIGLDALKNLVGEIAGHTGCTACGLLGVDLRLSGDPVEFANIAEIPGVQNVSFGR